jgi:aminoglycoside/choline kinase family phosphotransferase
VSEGLGGEQDAAARRAVALATEATGARVLAALPLGHAGLGTRRFLRLRLDGPPGSLVARIDVPEDPAGRPDGVAAEPALEPLRGFLEAAGLPVPASFGHDPACGIDLLEDLGDRCLADAVAGASDARRRALYAAVLDALPRLQALRDPGGLPAFARRLDAPLFAYKAELFAAHSLPRALGRAPRAAEREAVRAAFRFVAGRAAEAPQRLAHRDLQSHNVLVPEGRAPVWIDLQGALLAPPEYDLVCLLRDSYVELPRAEVEAHLARIGPALPDAPPPELLRLRFDMLTLTRKAKDHARFVDLAHRRGRADLLAHLPATRRALRDAARRLARADRVFEAVAGFVEALPEEAPACAR